LQLEEVLWLRISQLEPLAMQVLQLVCLADGKLAHQTAARAAGLEGMKWPAYLETRSR
jgi:hypothetical protein